MISHEDFWDLHKHFGHCGPNCPCCRAHNWEDCLDGCIDCNDLWYLKTVSNRFYSASQTVMRNWKASLFGTTRPVLYRRTNVCIECGVLEPFQNMTEDCCWSQYGRICEFPPEPSTTTRSVFRLPTTTGNNNNYYQQENPNWNHHSNWNHQQGNDTDVTYGEQASQTTAPPMPSTYPNCGLIKVAGILVTHRQFLARESMVDQSTQTPKIVVPNCIQCLAVGDESGWYLSSGPNRDGSRVVHYGQCSTMLNPATHVWARPCRSCFKPELLTGAPTNMAAR